MKQTKEKVTEILKADDTRQENDVHKARYLGALKQNNDKLDEEELGQSIGFSSEYTDEIIDALVADGKITSSANGTCHYKPTDTEETPDKK